MNKNRRFVRVAGFLLAGIMIALVFTITPGTYSYYRKEFAGRTTAVQAAGEKDFIKDMEIIYEKDVPYLKLTAADNMDYEPVIFFSIEGDLKEYILHIDPVRLQGQMKIPIVPNVNIPQSVSLIFGGEKMIPGTIKVKHLNEFIDKALDFKISRKYLLDRHFLNKKIQSFSMKTLSNEEKAEMEELVENMISYTSPYMDWHKVLWQKAGNSFAMEKDQNKGKSLPIGKVNISSSQSSMIDLIAPDLLKYNDELYSIMEVLVKDFNKLTEEKNVLEIDKDKLAEEKIGLSDTIKDLEKIIARFEADIVELDSKIIRLRDENEKLRFENQELYNKLSELDKNNNEDQLNRDIEDLRIENNKLREEIRHLNSRPAEKLDDFIPALPAENKDEIPEASTETVEE